MNLVELGMLAGQDRATNKTKRCNMALLQLLPRGIRRSVERSRWEKLQPAVLEDWLGEGWHRLESGDGGEWVWSTGRATINIPAGARWVGLQWESHYASWTGRPQRMRLYLDGSFDREFQVESGVTALVIACSGKRAITMEVDVVRPCDFIATKDARLLGICLYQFRIPSGVAREAAHASQGANGDLVITPNGPPEAFQVEITAACHLKCTMCPRTFSTINNPFHMTEAVWRRFFEAARLSQAVHFLGNGEPFAHPRFLDYLQQLDAAEVDTVFSTSGDLITPAIAKRLARLKRLDRVTFSIDSPDPKIYEAIRGQPLSRALAGLDCLRAELKHPERIRIVAVVMKNNMESMLRFPSLLREHEVRQFSMRGIIDTLGMKEEIPDYNERDRWILSSVAAECRAMGIITSVLPPIPNELISIDSEEYRSERPPKVLNGARERRSDGMPAIPPTRVCCDPWEKAIVTHEGFVFPCEVYNNMEPLGSLAESSFEEVWTGPLWNELRRRLLLDRSQICRICPRRHIGEHPYWKYSAEIDHARSELGGPVRKLVVKNIGLNSWNAETKLRIGTARRRDREGSAFYDESWLKPNRVASFQEANVAPGEYATFEFSINPNVPPLHEEYFQLVVDGERWLPNTEFVLRA